MATTAQDDIAGDDRKRDGDAVAAAKAPISTHPAFPFIVALWFAALLGLGSFVVPVALVEKVVLATGISAIVPATAPPLGLTARLLIAALCTVLGAIVGLFLARQVARVHAPKLPGEKRLPISAHAELGDDGLDGRPARGRRALAIADEAGPSEFFELAPLPQVVEYEAEAEPVIDDIDAVVETIDQEFADITAPELEAIDTQEDVEAGPQQHDATDETSPLPSNVTDIDATTLAPEIEEPLMSDRQDFETSPQESAPEDRQDFRPIDDTAIDDAWVEADPVTSDEAEEDMLELETEHEDAFEQEVVESPVEQETIAEEPAFPVQSGEAEQPAANDDNGLDELGLVQLAQRLGATIEKRRAMMAAKAELAATAAPAPASRAATPFEVAAPDDAAEAMAAYFSSNAPAVAPEAADDAAQSAPPAEAEATAEVEATDAAEREPVEEKEEEAFGFRPLNGFAPFAFDETEDEEDDIDDIAASFTLPRFRQEDEQSAPPPRSFDPPPGLREEPAEIAQEDAHDEADEAADDDDTAETGYGSLLSTNNPFRGRDEEFVRIEDEPEGDDGLTEAAVVFPSEQDRQQARETAAAGNAPVASARPFDRPAMDDEDTPEEPAINARDAEENERALREALLNLQRMSGAA